MKEKLLLVILCIGVLGSMLCMGAAAFDDIYDETTEQAVATLESMGIVSGTGTTTYSPSLILTRAQVCTMIIRVMGLESSAYSYINQNLFRDVQGAMWHAGYVNLAYQQGIINGYGNGSFGPDDDITYGQFLTMLLRLLGYTDQEIGRIWPSDYVTFAEKLGIDENVSLSANDPVTRGEAAVILYNALTVKGKGANSEYYRTMGGYASSVTAIVLNNNVSGLSAGTLQVCSIENSGATIRYYYQENSVPDTFIGSYGLLLLNENNEAIGFISDGNSYKDIVVASAKGSGITDATGNTYRISANTSVICNGSIYPYGTTGHVKVNTYIGQSARFYYDADGSIAYIVLALGTDASTTVVAVASSDAPASDFFEQLSPDTEVSFIFKNGGLADAAALAMYDVAYYDQMTNTLRVSDYKVTGYIESASPSVNAAKTITISGGEIGVLQCAWDTLGEFKLGDYVTLLLTDTGMVAAAFSPEVVSQDMYGILSKDGSSVTLCGSGVVLKTGYISNSLGLTGSLVKVNTEDADGTTCSGVIKTVDTSDILLLNDKTLGGVSLAPGCAIYEWSGNGAVYSLAGESGKSSTDLSEIGWTDRLDSSYVSFYHQNSVGLVDILLLANVTGNYYEFGEVTVYTGTEGVSISQGGSVYVNGAILTNDNYPSGSQKYVYSTSIGGYIGIALARYNQSYSKVASVSRTTLAKNTDASDFYLSDEDTWYVRVEDCVIPVNENVKVYVESTEKWFSGEEGLLIALTSELEIETYYDRTLTTGAQVRVIVVKKK